MGLNDATSKQPSPAAARLVSAARYLTVVSWCTYPFVYIIKNVGLAGNKATMYEQIGYSLADVLAKAVFGVLIWAIASEKSAMEDDEKDLVTIRRGALRSLVDGVERAGAAAAHAVKISSSARDTASQQ